MKILLITGKAASKRVEKIAQSYDCDIFQGDQEVATLLNPETIARAIGPKKDYGLIIVPGLIMGDVAKIEKATGIKTVRGPKDVADLELVLANLDNLELSASEPADEYLKDIVISDALKILKMPDSSKYIEKFSKKPGNLMIGGIPCGQEFPMRVISEIIGIENLSVEEIVEKGSYFKSSGADILDIGITKSDPKKVGLAIQALRKLDLPISIDTMDIPNIKAAIEADVDLILSFDESLIKEFKDVKIPSVIIPMKNNEIPINTELRVRFLEENIELAKKRGFKNIIADPILKPLNYGFAESIAAYRLFAQRNNYPILFGSGNITELIDADSIGINALLAGISMELGGSLLFTTEDSDKTTGSVRELSVASKMMWLAREKSSLPKDLGVDLLILKNKKLRRDPLPENLGAGKTTEAKANETHSLDKMGFFKIFVKGKIYCIHYLSDDKPNLVIEGYYAKEIYDTIIRNKLVGTVDHACYLGKELQRAENALTFGNSYSQE